MNSELTNILKEEEIFGGFQPGADDDETFLLEYYDDYPGELPYEIPEPVDGTMTENILPEEEIKPEFTIPEQVPSENEIPEEIQSEEITHEEVSSDVQEPTENPTEQEVTDEFQVPENKSVWDMFDESKAETQDVTNIPDESVSDEFIPEAVVASETVELDDELKELVKKEIKPKGSRQSAPSESKTTETNAIPDSEFKSVEELGHTEQIELSDYHAKHPSTSGLSAVIIPDIQGEVKDDKQTIESEKVKKEKEKEEKEEKKLLLLPWKIIGLAAAVIIFLASSILIGYLLFFKNPGILSNSSKKPSKSDTLITKKQVQKVQPIVKKIDTILKKVEPLAKVEPKPVIKEIPKKQPVQEKPKFIVSNKSVKKTEVKQPLPIKPKPVLATKVEKPAVQRKPIAQDNKKVQKPSKNTEEIYAVEVYSTPSKEDADDWVKRLANRNVSGIEIKSQKIRDATWYKIRFGKYSSREQARDAARKYGFAQCWIDRLK